MIGAPPNQYCLPAEFCACREFGEECGLIVNGTTIAFDSPQLDCCDGLVCCEVGNDHVCAECCFDEECSQVLISNETCLIPVCIQGICVEIPDNDRCDKGTCCCEDKGICSAECCPPECNERTRNAPKDECCCMDGTCSSDCCPALCKTDKDCAAGPAAARMAPAPAPAAPSPPRPQCRSASCPTPAQVRTRMPHPGSPARRWQRAQPHSSARNSARRQPPPKSPNPQTLSIPLKHPGPYQLVRSRPFPLTYCPVPPPGLSSHHHNATVRGSEKQTRKTCLEAYVHVNGRMCRGRHLRACMNRGHWDGRKSIRRVGPALRLGSQPAADAARAAGRRRRADDNGDGLRSSWGGTHRRVLRRR